MDKAFSRVIRRALVTVALAGLVYMPSAAQAQLTPGQQQAVDIQTGTASPGRAEEQFPGEEFVPRVTPRVEVQKMQIQAAPAGAENITFELGGIRMDGVTAYSHEELQAVYKDRIGATITLADLYGIAAEITRKYRNDGYILTQVVVPPQTIDGGIASLTVVEGAIDKVEIRGPEGTELVMIRDYAEQIKLKDPMNVADLERSLLLINDLPGVSARGVLNPSPNKTGAADLIIMVERKLFDAQVGIDNFGTRFLGPVQLSAAAGLNSYFKNNERIAAQYVIAPDKDNWELMYGALTYDQPLWEYGTSLQLAGSHTKTVPGYTLDQFDVEGWATTLSAQLTHPFIRTRSENLSGRVMFDYREITTKNNIPVDPTRRDHIRSLRFGGTYEMLDDLFGVAYNVVDVQFSRGLDVIGSNKEGRLDMSRPAADPTFFKMNADLQRLQRVNEEINLLFGFTGQWSNNPLLSSEEFGVGGLNYGRGYDPSEIIGDDGLAGKIELQWTEPYELSLLSQYQLYGFFDAGRVWNDDATTPQGEEETLTSTGLGIRADFNELTSAGFMLAFPLNNTPQTASDRDPRVYVNVNRRF